MKIKLLNAFATAFALLLSLLAATSVRAGTVSIGTISPTGPYGSDGNSGFNPALSYSCVFAFGNATAPANVNGVLVTHFDLPFGNNTTNTYFVADPNYGGGVTLTTGPNDATDTNDIDQANDSVNGQANGNTALLLGGICYAGNSGPTNDNITATFTNLTAGDSYTLRLYFREYSTTPDSRVEDVSFNGDGTNTFYSGNPFNQDAAPGVEYIEYDFIASSTNVLAALTNVNTVVNSAPMFYAASLVNNSILTSAYISAQPAVLSVVNGTVQLSATGGGTPPLAYQWYYNTSSNYTGATMETDGGGVSGSTSNVLTFNNNFTDYYFVVVTNDVSPYYATSELVQVDSQLLTVTSAGEPIWNQTTQTNIVVTFSDGLNPNTATNASNYSLSPGGSVTSAVLGGSNEVVLTTSTLSPSTSYTLQIQNVNDYFGIPMAPSPTNLAVGVYPSLALWVNATNGITGDGSGGVSGWADLSGNNNDLAGAGVMPYDPLLATNALGQQVVRFNATNETYLYANSSLSLAITNNISILAVVNFAPALADGNSNGWILGKDSAAGNVAAPYEYYVLNTTQGARLYSGNGTTYGQFSATNVPSVGVPHILQVTLAGATESHYLDGIPSGTGALNNSFNVSESSDDQQPLFVGTREDTLARLSGDISELMIVNGALSTYDVAAMQNYFATEYGLPATGSDSAPSITQEPVASTNLNQGTTLTVPAAANGAPAPAYQWYETNLTAQTGYALPGQTGALLIINDAQTNDNYYLEATNVWGAAMSSVVAVTVNSGLLALLPTTATASEGQSYPLTVTASGIQPITYQWYQVSSPVNTGGTLLGGANNATYNAIATLGSTYYYCAVTNSYGGTNAGPVDLIGAIVNLTWRGVAPTDQGNWDTSSATNWYNTISLANSPFYLGAAVAFDDTGLTNMVNIPNTVLSGPVTISANNTNYTFFGNGGISGTNGLTVSGMATTTIETTNSYTGVTTFGGGIVSVPILTIGGSNSPIGAATAGSTNLVFNGGELLYTGPSVSINRGLTLNANGGTVAVSSATTILTNSGAIVGTSGGGLTVSGNGALVLAGANAYNGPTMVNSGATLALASSSFGTGNITNNGTLAFSGVNVVTNNISGSGGLTNLPSAVTFLAGSNSFTGNVYIGASNQSPGSLVISNTYALNGTSTVTIAGGASTSPLLLLANNPATANTTSINIPSTVTLVELGNNSSVSRVALETVGGGTDYWNGPISLAGDGSKEEVAYLFATTNNSPGPGSGTLVVNGNITAALANNFNGALQLQGTGTSPSIGISTNILNGNFLLDTNVELEQTAGFSIINSTGNSCGFVFFNGVEMQLGANNALPENAPWRWGNCTLDLNGFSQEIFWMTNASGSTDGIITNSNPNTLSTLTYDNPGQFVYTGPNSGNANFNTGPFNEYNGDIGGYLALTVAGGTLQLGNTADSSHLIYTGPTTISSGSTLTLGGGTTIPNTPSITVAGGSTFSVSGLTSTFGLASGQILSNSTSTAILKGSANTASGTLSLTYSAGTPSFVVTNGTLTLSASTVFNVNNTGSALAAGSYLLISNETGGSVAGTVPSVTVTGGGVAANFAPSLSISSSDLYLVVAPSIPTSRTNIVFSASNGNLTLSWPTNYTGWTLQAQTNTVSVGISTNWVNVSGSTTINQVVIPINLTNGCVFYRLIYTP